MRMRETEGRKCNSDARMREKHAAATQGRGRIDLVKFVVASAKSMSVQAIVAWILDVGE